MTTNNHFNTPNPKTYISVKVGKDSFKTIEYKNYTIKEADMRIKTASFTTPKYLDLTTGQHKVRITSEGHENYEGIILNIEEDTDTGMYTYETIDSLNRVLSQKVYKVFKNVTVYDALKTLLKQVGQINALQAKSKYLQKQYEDIESFNPMNKRFSAIYDKVTLGEAIRSLVYQEKCFIDFHSNGVGGAVIEPYKPDNWLGNGLYFTTPELASYTLGFDITDIITNVEVKSTNALGKTKSYSSKELLGINLALYYGEMGTVIDNPNSNSSTGTSTSSTSGRVTKSKGRVKNKFNTPAEAKKVKPPEGCPTITVTGKPSTQGSMPPYSYRNYTKKWANFCPICNSYGYMKDNPKGVAEHELTCTKCDSDWDVVTGKNKAGSCPNPGCKYNWVYLIDANGKRNSKGNIRMDVGNVNSPNKSTTISTSKSNNAVVDSNSASNVEINKQKAMEAMTESVRNLLTFKIKLPGGNPLLKKLHTNSFIWTELPKRFQLKNFSKTTKSMVGSYTRYAGYELNRWYVESVTITNDDSGLWFEIELNPFASPYSTYTSILESATTAYTNATTKTSSNTDSSSGGYAASANVQALANKLTNSTSANGVMKDLVGMRDTPHMNYNYYKDFIHCADYCAKTKLANCCDGTRLMFIMGAFKNVPTSKLVYVHIKDHVYGKYNGTDYDWVKNGKIGVHWGSGGILQKTTFPKLPFGVNACGGGDILKEYEPTDINKVINERIQEHPTYSEVEFDDMEHDLEKIGRARW